MAWLRWNSVSSAPDNTHWKYARQQRTRIAGSAPENTHWGQGRPSTVGGMLAGWCPPKQQRHQGRQNQQQAAASRAKSSGTNRLVQHRSSRDCQRRPTCDGGSGHSSQATAAQHLRRKHSRVIIAGPYTTLAVEGIMMAIQARKRSEEETLLASVLRERRWGACRQAAWL